MQRGQRRGCHGRRCHTGRVPLNFCFVHVHHRQRTPSKKRVAGQLCPANPDEGSCDTVRGESWRRWLLTWLVDATRLCGPKDSLTATAHYSGSSSMFSLSSLIDPDVQHHADWAWPGDRLRFYLSISLLATSLALVSWKPLCQAPWILLLADIREDREGTQRAPVHATHRPWEEARAPCNCWGPCILESQRHSDPGPLYVQVDCEVGRRAPSRSPQCDGFHAPTPRTGA